MIFKRLFGIFVRKLPNKCDVGLLICKKRMNVGEGRMIHPASFSCFANSFSGTPSSFGLIKGQFCKLADIIDFFFVVHPESGRLETKESDRIFYFYGTKNESVDKQVREIFSLETILSFRC